MAGDPAIRCTVVGINYTPETTGIAPYTTGLAVGLAARGHRVRVITGVPHYPEWRVHDDFDAGTRRQGLDGVEVRRIRHYVPARPQTWRRALMEVIFGVRAALSDWGRPDVVVAVSPALFATAMITVRARLTGVPVITWVQDIYTLGIEQAGPGRFARALQTLESWVLRHSDRVVGIHDRFKRVITERLGARADRVDVIRNWSHLHLTDDAADPDIRARHGWGPEETVVLHAGNMGAKQGLDNVIAAAGLAAERGSAVRFVLLGDGNQRRLLEELASRSHPAHLQFIDPLPGDEFAATLAAADMLLVNERPGVIDMCVPSKLTSYFATGLPVLGAVDPRGITAEELAAAGAGPCVDAGDPEALLAAAERLAADTEAASRHGASGREFCRARLSEPAALDAFAASIATTVAVRRQSGRTVMPANSTPGTPVDSVQSQR